MFGDVVRAVTTVLQPPSGFPLDGMGSPHHCSRNRYGATAIRCKYLQKGKSRGGS
jgi:hypothetical protein